MFRDFLYLDEKILNNYLSVVDGVVITEREVKKIESKGKSGGANIPYVKGELNSQRSEEVIEKMILTEAAKFNELYSYMNNKDSIQMLNGFDDSIWKSVRRKEIIEADVILDLPEVFEQLAAAGDFLPLIGTIQEATGDIFSNPNDAKTFNAITNLLDSLGSAKIPVICSSECDEKYKFILELDRKWLKVDISELSDEVTILGKVQKVYDDNEVVEIFSFMPSLKGLYNREQRRKMKDEPSTESFVENVNGPAMKIIPLAIFR